MFLKELEKIVKNKIQNEIFINQDSREKKKKLTAREFKEGWCRSLGLATTKTISTSSTGAKSENLGI